MHHHTTDHKCSTVTTSDRENKLKILYTLYNKKKPKFPSSSLNKKQKNNNLSKYSIDIHMISGLKVFCLSLSPDKDGARITEVGDVLEICTSPIRGDDKRKNKSQDASLVPAKKQRLISTTSAADQKDLLAKTPNYLNIVKNQKEGRISYNRTHEKIPSTRPALPSASRGTDPSKPERIQIRSVVTLPEKHYRSQLARGTRIKIRAMPFTTHYNQASRE
jgi:hypothetical protein